MTGNLLGEAVLPFVKKEVENRQKLLGTGIDGSTVRSTAQLLYMNNRSPWIKLASSVQIDSSNRLPQGISNPEIYKGTGLAKKAVLFNGLSELNKDKSYNFRSGVSTSTQFWTDAAYGLGGTVQGIQPPPGIESVNVTSRNNGSIRSASVSIKAYNRFQFEIIETLYLRLGFTLLLEFGWDKYLDRKGRIQDTGRTLVEDEFFKSKALSQFDMIKKINSYQEKYKGNYDGFFGRVKNFAWDFSTDGTYNINVDLITLGDVIESLKINIPPSQKQKERLGGASRADIDTYGKVESSVLLANRNNSRLAAYLYTTIGTQKFDGADYFQLDKEVVENDESYKIDYEGRLNKNYRYYIRFGELINVIETQIIPNIKPKDKQLIFDKSAETTIMNYSPNLISFNPKCCLFRYDGGVLNVDDIDAIYVPQYTKNMKAAFGKEVKNEGEAVDYGKAEMKSLDANYVATTEDVKITGYDSDTNQVTLENGEIFEVDPKTKQYVDTNMFNFTNHVGKRFKVKNPEKLKNSSAVSGGGILFLKLYNIYFNYGFIFEMLKKNIDKEGNLSLFKFLEALCDGMNSSFANTTQVVPQIKDDKVVTFVERKPPSGLLKNLNQFVQVEDHLTLEVLGFNKARKQSNFLKNIKFNTKIGPKLSSMISIGATAQGTTIGEDATAFSKWNDGLVDRYQIEVNNSEDTVTDTLVSTNNDASNQTNTTETNTSNNNTNNATTVYYEGSDEELKAQLVGEGGIKIGASSTDFPAVLDIEGSNQHSKTEAPLLPVDQQSNPTINSIISPQLKQTKQIYRVQIDKDGNIVQFNLIYKFEGKEYYRMAQKNSTGEFQYTIPSYKYKLGENVNFDNLGMGNSVGLFESNAGFTIIKANIIEPKISEKLREIYGVGSAPSESEDSDEPNPSPYSDAELVAIDRSKKVANVNYSAYLAQMFGGQPSLTDEQKESISMDISVINKDMTQYFPNDNDEYAEMGKSAYKVYLKKWYGDYFKKSKNASTQVGFIPVEFNLDMDGISGFRIYNKLIIQQSFLPRQYSAALEFLITGISQKIDSSGWTTNIKTLSTANLDSPPAVKFNPAPEVKVVKGTYNSVGGSGEIPDSVLTRNKRVRKGALNAIKHPTLNIPIENGFLEKYGNLVLSEVDYTYAKVSRNTTNSKIEYKGLCHPKVKPYADKLFKAYFNAVSTNGKTFGERYGKIKINTSYRSVPMTPSSDGAAPAGTSQHGLGLAFDLQQPSSYDEVYQWFVANAPSYGFCRIDIFTTRSGKTMNETWHWEFQTAGPYAKYAESDILIASNCKGKKDKDSPTGFRCQAEYKVKNKQVNGHKDIKNPLDEAVQQKQIAAQTT